MRWCQQPCQALTSLLQDGFSTFNTYLTAEILFESPVISLVSALLVNPGSGSLPPSHRPFISPGRAAEGTETPHEQKPFLSRAAALQGVGLPKQTGSSAWRPAKSQVLPT